MNNYSMIFFFVCSPEKLQKKAEKKKLRKERKMEVKLKAQQQEEVQKLEEEEKLFNGCTPVAEGKSLQLYIVFVHRKNIC